jgi:hypothetical protein
MLRFLVFAVSLFLCGCGHYSAPSPTKRQAAARDFVGSWRYRTLDDSGKVSLTLDADGTFRQKVTTDNGRILEQEGQWQVLESKVVFRGVLVDSQDWSAGDYSWGITSCDRSPTGFVIHGGAKDPDDWVYFGWQWPDSE